MLKERRRTLLVCKNCRSRKLKVSKSFPMVSYPCSHYPSVVVSPSQRRMPLVSDVSKKELSANFVPSTRVQPRTTTLFIIKITPSSLIIVLCLCANFIPSTRVQLRTTTLFIIKITPSTLIIVLRFKDP